MSLACFLLEPGSDSYSRSRLWFKEQNVAQLSKLLVCITVDSFSGNTGTTGAFYRSTRFRFGESSDNDRERLRIRFVVCF